MIKQKNDVISLFNTAFAPVTNRFVVLDIALMNAAKSTAKFVNYPGVYVFWSPEHGVVKVGRSLTNSRKRALEHITDDTGKMIANLAKDPLARLLLFNVREPEEAYWSAALEIYLEDQLEPKIKAGRRG